MNIEAKTLERLIELIKDGDEILNTSKTLTQYPGGGYSNVGQKSRARQRVETINMNRVKAEQWRTSCLYFLEKVFGEGYHLKSFEDATTNLKNYSVGLGIGVLNAARDDCENSFLFDIRTLIEAEVFDDFLEQAEQLHNKGYFQPAAVIAGSVLEDGLRKLCDRNSVELSEKPKLDKMNADLAKAGVYNRLQQKKITALADIRNSAAHGRINLPKKMLKT